VKNIERLNGILDWLESDVGLLFNMGSFVSAPHGASKENNWCGTSCCIAGYTAMNYGSFIPDDGIALVFDEAMDLLELTYDEARALFYCKSINGTNLWIELNEVTRPQAAQAVRNLIDCGDPKWGVICATRFS